MFIRDPPDFVTVILCSAIVNLWAMMKSILRPLEFLHCKTRFPTIPMYVSANPSRSEKSRAEFKGKKRSF